MAATGLLSYPRQHHPVLQRSDCPLPGARPPPALLTAGWPGSGLLTYSGVSAIYRPGLPPVLQDLSFELQARPSAGFCIGWLAGWLAGWLNLYRWGIQSLESMPGAPLTSASGHVHCPCCRAGRPAAWWGARGAARAA